MKNIDIINVMNANPAMPDRSNERADVARRILELSGTVSEAIGHMAVCTELSGVLLKDVCESIISLEKAVESISVQSGLEPDDVQALEYGYDDLSERMDNIIDAYLEDRKPDFYILATLLQESFSTYEKNLLRCFRGMAVM